MASYAEIARTAVENSGNEKDAWRELEQMLQPHYDSPLIVDFALRRAARDTRTTIKSTLGKLHEFEEYLNAESLSLSDVSDGDVRNYTDSLAFEGQLINTIDWKISTICGLYDFLEEEHGIDAPDITVEGSDYAGRVPEAIERQAIPRKEVRKLIQSAHGVRDTLIIAMFYYTGMRRRELVQCNLNDVNFDERYILVRRGKGNKSRTVPFREELDRLLSRWTEQVRPYYPRSEDSALFLAEEGGDKSGRLSYKQCYRIVMRAAEDAGIQEVLGETSDGRNKYRVKPHVLRHSVATHMVNDGVPLRYIKRILGHESVQTTLRYAKEPNQAVFSSYHSEFGGI